MDFVYQVLAVTAASYSSMARDVHSKRRTDVTQLSGFVVNLGAAHGIECSANVRQWRQIETLDQVASQSCSSAAGRARPVRSGVTTLPVAIP